MSLLLNMLSRLVITFLPRSKRLLISWLQSPSVVILVTERKGVALGVLTQSRGPHQQTIAYVSRELDVVSRGWPHSLRVIGAAALLAPEALKIINGQTLLY